MSISATEQELALPQLIHVAGIPLNVAVFADAESRQQGLMDVTYLPEFSGGLFIYEQPATLSFWMKNTPIPLDMLFFNEQRRLVHIARNVQPCYEINCPLYTAPASQYVVETSAGFAAQHQINLNAILTID